MATYTEIRDKLLDDLASGAYAVKTFTVDGQTVERPSLSEFKELLKYVTDRAAFEQQSQTPGFTSRTQAVSNYGRGGR